MQDVIVKAKDIKKSDYDSFSEYAKAYKEAKMNEKILEKKKKARKYKKVYYNKQAKAKERIKRNEKKQKERALAKEKKEKEDLNSKRFVRVVKDKEFDFMKYRFIVDYYFKKTYFPDLTKREYEFVFFMYSEPPFDEKFFLEVTKGFGYNRYRLDQMVERGIFYVHLDEKNQIDKRRKHKLYDMTIKTRRAINLYYKTLVMAHHMPEKGIIFNKKARNTVDYRFAKHIQTFNERRKQYYEDVALMYNDINRVDLNQRTFGEILEDLKEDLEID